jgi:hypothetical protein
MNDDTSPDHPSPVTKQSSSPRDPDLWVHRSMAFYRTRKRPLEFRPGPAFFELADFVMQRKRTMLGYDRLYTFWQAAGNLVNVPGAVAEVGSYRGGSAYFIASAFKQTTGGEVPMHVFDTFEGHPEDAITEHDEFHEAGQFQRTTYEGVCKYLSPFSQLQIHKGDVTLALPHLPESTYRLVHIDTDLYQPTNVCLDYFGQRISPGGVIVLDDYASKKCPGVPKALAEYQERTNDEFQIWDVRTEQLVLVKR